MGLRCCAMVCGDQQQYEYWRCGGFVSVIAASNALIARPGGYRSSLRLRLVCWCATRQCCKPAGWVQHLIILAVEPNMHAWRVPQRTSKPSLHTQALPDHKVGSLYPAKSDA